MVVGSFQGLRNGTRLPRGVRTQFATRNPATGTHEAPARRYGVGVQRISDSRLPIGSNGCLGDRHGQYSIRINRQWRVCFRWGSQGPEDIEITDYH